MVKSFKYSENQAIKQFLSDQYRLKLHQQLSILNYSY